MNTIEDFEKKGQFDIALVMKLASCKTKNDVRAVLEEQIEEGSLYYAQGVVKYLKRELNEDELLRLLEKNINKETDESGQYLRGAKKIISLCQKEIKSDSFAGKLMDLCLRGGLYEEAFRLKDTRGEEFTRGELTTLLDACARKRKVFSPDAKNPSLGNLSYMARQILEMD